MSSSDPVFTSKNVRFSESRVQIMATAAEVGQSSAGTLTLNNTNKKFESSVSSSNYYKDYDNFSATEKKYVHYIAKKIIEDTAANSTQYDPSSSGHVGYIQAIILMLRKVQGSTEASMSEDQANIIVEALMNLTKKSLSETQKVSAISTKLEEIKIYNTQGLKYSKMLAEEAMEALPDAVLETDAAFTSNNRNVIFADSKVQFLLSDTEATTFAGGGSTAGSYVLQPATAQSITLNAVKISSSTADAVKGYSDFFSEHQKNVIRYISRKIISDSDGNTSTYATTSSGHVGYIQGVIMMIELTNGYGKTLISKKTADIIVEALMNLNKKSLGNDDAKYAQIKSKLSEIKALSDGTTAFNYDAANAAKVKNELIRLKNLATATVIP